MTTGMMAVWPSAEMRRLVAALVGADDAVDDARAEGRDALLQRRATSARNAGSVALVAVERTMTTSLAFCGMFMRCCSRSRPPASPGLPRKRVLRRQGAGEHEDDDGGGDDEGGRPDASVSHGRLAEPRASVVVESRMM